MKNKKIKLLTLFSLSAILTTSMVSADIQTDTVDEVWGKPTLVYGAGLSDSQVEQTNSAFNIKKLSNVYRQVNSGIDFQTYLGIQGVADSNLYSSVLVQKQNKGSGVTVDIKTPNNITAITKTQYANAAITAGASDVKIDVASVTKVTGESALVGVYKALSVNGQEVDQNRAAVASQELSTVNAISNEQSSNKAFDSTALDLATAQIKKELADYKKSNGEVASSDKVQEIIKKALKDNKLDGVLSDENIKSLVAFAETYQSTSAIDSQEVADQLKTYANDTYKSLSDKFKNLKNSEEAQGIMKSISNFFEGLFKSVSNFFSNL